MMKPLNLLNDDPDDFEGKIVTYNGCEYIIGTYLGTGADKIAHKLINKQSGLCMHVIKFFRDLEAGEQKADIVRNAEGTLFRGFAHTEYKNVIPNQVIVTGHGGIFQIQDYAGHFEDESKETSILWIKANKLREASRLQEATILYEKILKLNPYHTPTIINLASIKNQQGDIQNVVSLMIRLIDIEPNYYLYLRAYIYLVGGSGYIRLGLEQYENSKIIFPYQYECDELAVELYLLAGNPHRAKEILDETITKMRNKNKWKSKVEKALKARERAFKNVNEARGKLNVDDIEAVYKLMKKAYSIYPDDIMIKINYALALSRANQLKKSTELLLSLILITPHELTMICYANSAFNEIRENEYETAIVLLETLTEFVQLMNNGMQVIDLTTIPGITIWVEYEVDKPFTLIEERITSANELIASALKNTPEPISQSLRTLSNWYQQAAMELG